MYLTPQPTISAGYNSLGEFELLLFDYLEYRLSLLGSGSLSVMRKSGYISLDDVSDPLTLEFVLKHKHIYKGDASVGTLTVVLNYAEGLFKVGYTPDTPILELVHEIKNSDLVDFKSLYADLIGSITEKLKGCQTVPSNLVLEPSVYAHDLFYDDLPFSVSVEVEPNKSVFRRYTQYGMVIIERELHEPYAKVELKYDGVHLEGYIKDVIPYASRDVYTVISNTLQNELKKRGN